MKINLAALGDAQCPSAEMLKGIVDINDPCQSNYLPPSTAVVDSSLLNTLDPLSQGQINSLPISPGSSITTNTIYIAGAALVAFMLFMGGRRR